MADSLLSGSLITCCGMFFVMLSMA